MGHSHTHSHAEGSGDAHLIVAIAINILLTIAQVVGGIFSGSLSLIADALHNFSDAGALVIAYGARRIGRLPADDMRTFGYKRAETIGALINLTTLIVLGLYLVYEAVERFIDPRPVAGWTVIVVAGIALVIDVVTAVLTYSMSKASLNVKAAFLHNVSDALASVAVIVVGVLILRYELYVADPIATFLIAGYVLYQGFSMIRKTIHILMEGTPEGIEIQQIIQAMCSLEGIVQVHHVHVWSLDEQRIALEAHVVLSAGGLQNMDEVKRSAKAHLAERFGIEHSTLEFEEIACDSDGC